MKQILSKNLAIPLAAYVAVMAAIIISRAAIGQEYALLLSAGFMLWVPFLLDRRTADVFRFDPRRLLRGAGISIAVLFSYVVCLYLLSGLPGKDG